MFQFESYILDVGRGCLRAGEREIDLRPKSFEVLRYLVERAGRLVTKDEILDSVWPNVSVSDESLAQCVSEVRRAIGDGDQTIIKTVPRRGYRFVAPVSQTDIDTPAPPDSRMSVAATARGRRVPDRPSVAVLPFANLSGDPQHDYFSDGMSEDIITELSRFSELLVIARNSTFRYKGGAMDVRRVGRELGARYVLEGSIRRAGDRVRITAQLIDAASGGHLWAERYDRELNDVFAVQDEVARAIAAILAAHVNRAEAERTLLKPPARWEAYDYYLRAAEVYPLRARTGIYEARRLLDRSLAIDPGYARAHALLSWTHWWTYVEPVDDNYLRPAGLDLAHDLAKKAVRLDPYLPQAHAQLGWVLLFRREHEASLAAFGQAFALNPNYVDHRLALVLGYAGEPTRAIEAVQANTARDPFHPFLGFGFLGHAHYMLRHYDEAVELLRAYPTRAPNVRILPLWLAAAYGQLGRLAEARAEVDQVLRIEPGFAVEKWKCTATYKNREDAEHLFEGLRKAGAPEH